MARKTKKTNQTQDQIDKQQRLAELKVKLQALADTNKFEYMSEFSRAWNSKNPEKIEECMKMGNTFNFHFKGGAAVMIVNDTMRLG